MKTCPKCQEKNGENRTTCYNCGTTLESYKKVCRKCEKIYEGKIETCPDCGCGLSVYSPSRSHATTSVSHDKIWAYVLTFLMPIIGLILGLIYVGQKDDDGKPLLIFSVALTVIYGFIILALI